MCAQDAITFLPDYLGKTVTLYLAEIDDCIAPDIPFGFEEASLEQATKDDQTSASESLDHYCKAGKMRHLEKLLESIKVRSEAWLAYAQENPSVKGFQALFTQQEKEDATRYVPRWPLLVHLSAAIIMLSFSAYYHLFCC